MAIRSAPSSVPSPKRPISGAEGRDGWFDYYAGFSPAFVDFAASKLGLGNDSRLLDPWNGGGTTTDVAHKRGVTAAGYDINPVMVVVAKARLLGDLVTPSELPLSAAVQQQAAPESPSDVDPLTRWFQPSSAIHFRAIERSIQSLFVTHPVDTISSTAPIAELSPLAAFFYVALFRTVRDFLGPFLSSNPTWIKRPTSHHLRVSPHQETIYRRFRRHVEDMVRERGPLTQRQLHGDAHVTVAVGDARALPCDAGSFDAMISSPPYCTRLDYAVATAPELAVLGYNDDRFSSLRRSVMGAAILTSAPLSYYDGWGPTCAAFLSRVATHSAKASAGYYLRHHLQYFNDAYRSLIDIDRVLRPGAQCAVVVQDSHYKDIHNDLPQIYCEMVDSIGWAVVSTDRFSASSLMARLHPGTRRYRPRALATETVLWLKKQ